MKLSDDILTFALGIITLFVFLSGQEKVATFYGLMLLLDAYFFGRDEDVRLPFERSDKNRMEGFLTAAGVYIGYIMLVPAAVMSIYGIKLLMNHETILQITQAMLPDLIISAPLFSMITKAAFGIQETRFFFARGPEFLADQFGLSLDIDSRSVWIWISAALGFVGFHIFIKKAIDLATGLNTGLIATTVFAIVSIGLIIYQKQHRDADILHGGTNFIAEYLQLKAKGIILTIKDII